MAGQRVDGRSFAFVVTYSYREMAVTAAAGVNEDMMGDPTAAEVRMVARDQPKHQCRVAEKGSNFGTKLSLPLADRAPRSSARAPAISHSSSSGLNRSERPCTTNTFGSSVPKQCLCRLYSSPIFRYGLQISISWPLDTINAGFAAR